LTAYLITLDPPSFQTATTHPFLSHAGSGTLPPSTLSAWLAQDRLYAIAYIRFASQLVARCSLLLPPASSKSEAGRQDVLLAERVLDLLIDALTNVRREVRFFEATAQEYGLDLSSMATSDGLSGYRSLFETWGTEKVGNGMDGGVDRIVGLLPALVLLWGTEICYLTAWRHAASHIPPEADVETAEAAAKALWREFIPNWSSKEFEGFVERIGRLVDEVWGTAGGDVKGRMFAELEDVWRRVLGVERVFWPDV
ncbi:hypothetical protein BJ875DRAFT_519128, partial [Amylocarpus encephaloides]